MYSCITYIHDPPSGHRKVIDWSPVSQVDCHTKPVQRFGYSLLTFRSVHRNGLFMCVMSYLRDSV